MSKVLILGEAGAYGQIEIDSAEEFVREASSQATKWGLEIESVRPEMTAIAADQLLKWTGLRDLFGEHLFREKISESSAISLLEEAALDIDLLTFDSPFYSAKRDSRIFNDIFVRDPKFIDSPNLKKIISQYRAAAIAIRSFTVTAEQGSIIQDSLKNYYDELTSNLRLSQEKIAELGIVSNQLGEDLLSKRNSSLAEIAVVTDKANEVISVKSKNCQDELSKQSQAVIGSLAEYQKLLDAAKTAELMDDSVRGWSELSQSHARKAADRIRAASIITILTILITPSASLLAFYISKNILAPEDGGVPRLIFSGVTALMCLTFGIWATRIAIRSYMAEEHLKNDSANRVSITNAFIKLQKSLKLADEDRKILLQTIMRPATDGIVQDDGLPQGHPAAMLVQLIDPKKATPGA